MLRFSLTSLLLVLFLVCQGTSQNPAPRKKARSHRTQVDHPSTPATEPWVPRAEVDPPVPLRPVQMPAVQQHLSYRDGLIKEEAPNCSLACVITSILTNTCNDLE